jgi:YfiR/HmsC-like
MINSRPQKHINGKPCRRFASRIDSHRIRQVSIFIVACLFLNVSPKAFSSSEKTVEYPVKLAFLYNFTKFVEWPAQSYRGPGAPLVICIAGDDPFDPDNEGELRTRTVESHPIEIRPLRTSAIMNDCHMVFVPATAEGQAARILRGLKGSSTLTVGETEGFAVLGGIINLTAEGNTLHFEINLLAADRAGLKISANMLALAKIIPDEKRSGED